MIIPQLMSFAFVFVIFLFSRITNRGLYVFLFPRFTVFMSFFFHESRFTVFMSSAFPLLNSALICTLSLCRVQPLKVSFSCCMSFFLAFRSILLLPCFSFYFSPTSLFVLYRHLPCYFFYTSPTLSYCPGILLRKAYLRLSGHSFST